MYQKHILLEKLREAAASVLPITGIVAAMCFVLVPMDTGLITSNPQLGKPDYQLALQQHEACIEALKKTGVEVTVLPPVPTTRTVALWRTMRC